MTFSISTVIIIVLTVTIRRSDAFNEQRIIEKRRATTRYHMHDLTMMRIPQAIHNTTSMMSVTSWNSEEPLDTSDMRVTPRAAEQLKKEGSSNRLAVKRAFLRFGVGEPDDGVRTHCRQKALRLLKGHVLDAIVDDKKNAEQWNFTSVPLECFGKTMDDLLVAFLAWSKIEDDDECYDVSKAFARLGDYAAWMHSRRDELRGITNESVGDARKAWNIMTSQDKLGRVVWWLDLASVEGLEKLTVQDSLRFFVWFAHSLIFRPQVQHHGVAIVTNLGKVDLATFLSMLPPNLTRKLERFTINILPIKTEQMYVTGSPTWCNFFMTIIKPLISDELRRRMVTLESPAALNKVLGVDCVPEGFGMTVKEIAAHDALQAELIVPREIFRAHGIEAPLVLPEEPAPLLREWKS